MYAILGYKIRYIYLLHESGTKERSFGIPAIGCPRGIPSASVSPLTSASPRNAAHRYVTDILVREENLRGARPLVFHARIHAFRRGWTQNKDLDWPRSLSPVWNNNAVLSSIRITRDHPWIRRARGEVTKTKMFISRSPFLIQPNDFSEFVFLFL